MNIAIIGAGSMGALFGAKLLLAGHAVTMITRRQSQAAWLNQHGLLLDMTDKTECIPVHAVSEVAQAGQPDAVLFFVKAYDTQAAADSWKTVDDGNATLITLQNGLGNAEILASLFGPERVLAGTTSTGCTRLGDGHLQLNHLGNVQLGAVTDEGKARALQIAAVFNAAGLTTVVEEDIHHTLWTKLFVNVGINAITALTGRKNGQLMEEAETATLLEMAVAEAVTVARKRGLDFELGAVLRQVVHIAQATGNNRSSMLQDVEQGRRTEVDMINGAVVQAGRQIGLEVPVNQTLTLLVKALEKTKIREYTGGR